MTLIGAPGQHQIESEPEQIISSTDALINCEAKHEGMSLGVLEMQGQTRFQEHSHGPLAAPITMNANDCGNDTGGQLTHMQKKDVEEVAAGDVSVTTSVAAQSRLLCQRQIRLLCRCWTSLKRSSNPTSMESMWCMPQAHARMHASCQCMRASRLVASHQGYAAGTDLGKQD